MTALAIAEPVPEPPDGVFPALLEGLREFRRRVEGTDEASPQGAGAIRDKILELQKIEADALGKKIAMAMLEGLRDIIAALHTAITEINSVLIRADAVFALIEVLGRALSALGETLQQPWPPPMAFANDAGSSLITAGNALEQATGLVESLPIIIPMPSTLTAILAETRALLGTLVEPTADPPTGSLVALITELKSPTPP
jgi:hypothetical protein